MYLRANNILFYAAATLMSIIAAISRMIEPIPALPGKVAGSDTIGFAADT
jgi:hypothetical protein